MTMWTMTQRAGSTTYHIFTAGTSLLVLALMVVLREMGTVAPARWGPRARKLGLALGGIHTTSSPSTTSGHGSEKLRLRWHVLEVFGENALAVYVLSDGISDPSVTCYPMMRLPGTSFYGVKGSTSGVSSRRV